MNARWLVIAGAVLAGVGVALGAFGAHGLDERLRQLGHEASLDKRLAWYETAVRYQIYHALAILVIAGLAGQLPASRGMNAAASSMIVGIALFSGSLYAMTFAGDAWRKLGMVTPVGGLAFIVGWVLVVVAAWRR